MPDTETLYDQLIAVTKHPRQADEDFEAFAKESCRRINKLSDKAWEGLSDPLQTWCNSAQKALEAKEAPPELAGFPEEAPAAEEAGAAETLVEEAEKPRERVKPKGAKKEKAVKKAKQAKPAKAAKKAAKKAANGSKGRPPLYDPDAKIKMLVKENPHREGTGRFKRWPKYKDGMTVADAIKAGFQYENLRFSVADGHIKIVGA